MLSRLVVNSEILSDFIPGAPVTRSIARYARSFEFRVSGFRFGTPRLDFDLRKLRLHLWSPSELETRNCLAFTRAASTSSRTRRSAPARRQSSQTDRV